MRRPPIRVLDLTGSPGDAGRAHGSAFAEEIRAYTADRVSLAASGAWSGGRRLRAGEVLELAESCLPAHESYSASLYEEMTAMAEAAGITPAEAVVVGGFTDLVDTIRAAVGAEHPAAATEDDCTAFIVPDGRAGGAALFGQTWDMHDSATDHVILLRARLADSPAALVFTTTGCLGQIGMNELGVCVGINNLTAADGRSGVTWPTVVRQALRAENAEAALEAVLDAELAGGHNYLILDAEGCGFNVEAMPTARPVTTLGARPLVHANHTVDAAAGAVQGLREPELQESSLRRMAAAAAYLDKPRLRVEDLMELTRGGVCQTSTPPHKTETSGAVVARPRTGEFWAVWGLPPMNDYQRFDFAQAD